MHFRLTLNTKMAKRAKGSNLGINQDEMTHTFFRACMTPVRLSIDALTFLCDGYGDW